MVRLVSALVSLAVANAAFFGGAHSERQPRYRDHWVRMHPSARRSAAKVLAKREQAMEEHKRMLQMSDESKAAYASAKAKEMSTIMADKNLTEEERKRKVRLASESLRDAQAPMPCFLTSARAPTAPTCCS